MASEIWRFALIGADEPLGTAFLEALQDQGPEAATPLAVTLGEAEGYVDFRGAELPCVAIQDLDWRQVQAAVLATRSPAALHHARQAALRGLPVLASADLAEGMPECCRPVRNAAAAAMLRVLGAVSHLSELLAVSAYVGLPMAALGQAGIDELANQSRALFAMEDAEPAALPLQIAFNLLPQVGNIDDAGLSQFEVALEAQLRAACGDGLMVQTTAAWQPTFFGAVVVLHGQCVGPLSRQQLLQRFAHVPGTRFTAGVSPASVPTPAVDPVGDDAIHVGRLVVHPRDERRFSLWLTFDHPRVEAAQLLEGLEKLIESAAK